MKRVLCLVALVAAIGLVPEPGWAAPRQESREPVETRAFTPLASRARAEVASWTKSSCSSDAGDSCTCGPGKLCVSGADGCACIRPAQ